MEGCLLAPSGLEGAGDVAVDLHGRAALDRPWASPSSSSLHGSPLLCFVAQNHTPDRRLFKRIHPQRARAGGCIRLPRRRSCPRGRLQQQRPVEIDIGRRPRQQRRRGHGERGRDHAADHDLQARRLGRAHRGQRPVKPPACRASRSLRRSARRGRECRRRRESSSAQSRIGLSQPFSRWSSSAGIGCSTSSRPSRASSGATPPADRSSSPSFGSAISRAPARRPAPPRRRGDRVVGSELQLQQRTVARLGGRRAHRGGRSGG